MILRGECLSLDIWAVASSVSEIGSVHCPTWL